MFHCRVEIVWESLIADYIIDSDRDLFYSADKSITFAFVPGYDSGTDVKEGE